MNRSLHRYSPGALIGDYLRAATGLLLTGGPALLLETAPTVTVVLGGLAGLFGLFGLRVGLRQATVIEVSEEAVEARGVSGSRLAWDEIDRVRLDYFSTRRDGGGGWLQMKITGRGGGIRAESSIGDFEKLAASVAANAKPAAGMSDTTLENFRSLGIEIDVNGDSASAG